VKKDLEKGVLPLHVHVDIKLTKGEYADYDTFLGPEAVELLHLYLDERRKGSVWRVSQERSGKRIPPETIRDNSPLIRDSHNVDVHPISTGRIWDVVHGLYVKAGLLPEKLEEGTTRYDLRAHSLRKFFRTQLAALGVNSDYINYMMGHVVDTYHDVQMKGVEFLRNIYAASNLCIKPKTQLSRLEMLKQFAQTLGIPPESVLVKEVQATPHRTYVSGSERAEESSRVLAEAIRRELGLKGGVP
jgi:hypothetical protein